MPTRQKRPSIIKQLALSVLMAGFLVYMGFSAISGKYGIQSKQKILEQIEILKGESTTLQAEIERYRQRIALFDPKKLDPDILSERARSLLSMVHEDDRLVIIPDSQQ